MSRLTHNMIVDHFGVIKAFLDADLLPRIITGTSAGALVAAMTCTHTDEELRKALVPELANRINACQEPLRVWATRFWKTGARFDAVDWARKVELEPSLCALLDLTSHTVMLVHFWVDDIPRGLQQDRSRAQHLGSSL